MDSWALDLDFLLPIMLLLKKRLSYNLIRSTRINQSKETVTIDIGKLFVSFVDLPFSSILLHVCSTNLKNRKYSCGNAKYKEHF